MRKMNILYIFFVILIFFLSVYFFKAMVAKYRMEELDIYPEGHNYFYFYLPIITIVIIARIALKKKFHDYETNVSPSKMLIKFNLSMDIMAMITKVIVEEQVFEKKKSLLEKITEYFNKFNDKNPYFVSV
ncbi:hypothetical protein HYQ40_08340 [Aerococcaceae bacterium DSM 111021]|nr:hypothetical protein [Aerococcaceae bacterium DSM 111021]